MLKEDEPMKILLGYDGSNAANDALNLTKKYAAAFGATVSVVTSMAKATEGDQEIILQAERALQYAQSVFEKDKIDCNTHLLVRGLSTGEDIVRFAADNGVDLIIVGVKRRSKVGKILLGSTAQYVIIKAPCPVLSVK
jgi:nucleotide-binding universal stress UspA family protein